MQLVLALIILFSLLLFNRIKCLLAIPLMLFYLFGLFNRKIPSKSKHMLLDSWEQGQTLSFCTLHELKITF